VEEGDGRGLVIALDGVTKRYGARVVLAPTTLTVAAGAAVALVGPSGSGKSTLLRTVVGLVEPDAGTVEVAGMRLTPATATAVRRRVGYVIQEGGLFPHLTAHDNVALMARHLGWSRTRVGDRVDALAALVHVERDLLARFPSQLSGGERQRVGIMRALMLDPPVLLLDEPLGALDPVVRARLRADLRRIFGDLRKTVLVVTHDVAEAAYLGDEIAVLRDGHLVQRGNLRALQGAPADSFVREFVETQEAPCP
jgi:osmoprotectant transport system ATP-binding protein